MKKIVKRIRRVVVVLLVGMSLLYLYEKGLLKWFRKQPQEVAVQVQQPGRDSYRFYLRPAETAPAETEPAVWSISG